jgi:phenylalanyl-tRNA synthetase beta chain
VGTDWERRVTIDFFDLKGAVEGVADALGVELAFRPAEVAGFVPGTAAQALRDGAVVGVLGRVAGEDASPLYAAELLLESLPVSPPVKAVDVPSRFPGIAMDLTLTHAVTVPWSDLAQAVRQRMPADLEWFRLVVRYQGEGVPAGAVNTTLGFYYASAERSLTQAEVNERHMALRDDLERRFGWRAAR